MQDNVNKGRSSELAQIQIARAKLHISNTDFLAILAETTGYESISYLDERGRRDVLDNLNSLSSVGGTM